MNNLSQIITLLQLVLALLSNPQMAQNPQVQTLAQQAVVSATQALTVVVEPTSTPVLGGSSQPIINQPTQTVVETPAPIIKSCNLVITPDNGNGMGLTWTSENEQGNGILYNNNKGIVDGGVTVYQVIEPMAQPNGTMVYLRNFTQAKLVFMDGTTCTAQF